MNSTTFNGLILSGMHSSGGKTAVTCMMLAALAQRGIALQPFKVGPDFIDPSYHARFSRTPSRNLDEWMMGNEGILREVAQHGAGRIGIVEGVMGLFDGSDPRSDKGSAMELARLLNWPIVLVIPSAKTGRSVAASLRGFIEEAGEGRIIGVILNEVGGPGHADYLRQAIEPLNLPVLGAIPHCEELAWPERHLGLQASQERCLPKAGELAQLAEKYLDIPRIVSLLSPAPSNFSRETENASKVRIGLARDTAFHFYYEANLDFLRQNGVELVEFSPINDPKLPSGIDGLLFGGGFPEVFAHALSQNQSMRSEIRSAIDSGMPCYAECGGLMFLSQELIAGDGKRYPMVGSIPGGVEMTKQLHQFGYCTASGLPETPDAEFRGHEFHYSRWNLEPEAANLWTVRRKRLGTHRREGYSTKNLRASYVHLHFPTSQNAVGHLLKHKTNLKAL